MFLVVDSLEGFKDGDWVTVYGRLDPGLSDIPPCPNARQGYDVQRIERQLGTPVPAATATPVPDPSSSDPRYGHAPDYSWLRGRIQVTRIQGGCVYLVYDPTGRDPYGGTVVPDGQIDELKDGEFVMVTGYFSEGPRVMCPGRTYTVTSVKRQ